MRNQIISFALCALVVCGTASLLSEDGYVGFAAAREEGEGYRPELDRLERRIKATARLVQAAPQSWMRRVELASLLLERASLAARHDDYLAASRELDVAAELGPNASAVHMLRAQLAFGVHQFDRVEGHLALAEDSPGVLAMRGSLAFERGDYDAAESLLEQAVDVEPSYDALARLAHLHFRTCRLDSALGLLADAEAMLPKKALRARAWIELQRGHMALERGQLAEAREAYAEADATYPGWWLVEEHIAEVDALAGRNDEARVRYQRLVDELGTPDVVGALASLTGDPALLARARAGYEEQLETLPEASYGHALGHFLAQAPAKAVALAEKNRALRPNGEARTLLARAYLKVGRIEDARAELAAVKATRWCSAATDDLAETLAELEG